MRYTEPCCPTTTSTQTRRAISIHDLEIFPVCSSTSPCSKTADLGPFEMSDHQVLVSSSPSISLPKLFPSLQISSPSYLFNRGSLQMFGKSSNSHPSSQGVGDHPWQLTTADHELILTYERTLVRNSSPEPEPCHHLETRSPKHNLGAGRM